LQEARGAATMAGWSPSRVIHRTEALATIGALSDLVVEVREIRYTLREDEGDDEEDAEGP
jgi:hypothetical protein